MDNNLRNLIRDMINQTVTDTVREIITETLGASGATSTPRLVAVPDAEPPLYPRRTRITEGAIPGKTPLRYTAKDPEPQRERRNGPRTEYVTVGRMTPSLHAKLRGNDRIAYDYVAKHSPTTADKVEAGTPLGRKSVESALYSLRTLKLVKSRPIA